MISCIKEVVKVSLILMVFGLFLSSCAKKSDESGKQANTENDSVKSEVVKTEWAIGETCPAGGMVFYDKGEVSDGWRYLSVAPSSTEFIAAFCTGWYGVGVEDGIGTGKKNTEIILESVNSDECDYDFPAAQLCVALNIGGYTDWFLPSIGELKLMYKNLYAKGLGNFTEEGYLASSVNNWKYNIILSFVEGEDMDNYTDYYGNNLDTPERVRAIRQF